MPRRIEMMWSASIKAQYAHSSVQHSASRAFSCRAPKSVDYFVPIYFAPSSSHFLCLHECGAVTLVKQQMAMLDSEKGSLIITMTQYIWFEIQILKYSQPNSMQYKLSCTVLMHIISVIFVQRQYN